MSPRDRKRDRVLKRRRASKKREQNEANDDALEQSYVWYHHAERAFKKPKLEQQSSNVTRDCERTPDGMCGDDSSDDKPQMTHAASVKTDQTTPIATQESNAAKSSLTKEERQRIKNQQRQALRKLKKAKKEEMKQEILTNQKQMQLEAERQARQLKNDKKQKQQKAKDNDFQTLRLGVQYKDITIGNGPLVQDRKKVRVSYKLRVEHRCGKVIDSSKDFRFRLGKGEVIKGWDIGLVGMRQGGVRHLIVPPKAGYGSKDVGAGRGGQLFFEVSLLSC